MIDLSPLLRLYARRRRAALEALDPVAAQERELMKLVRMGRDTQFGREHGFAEIRSVADFQARVPLRAYEEFWSRYWQPSFPRLENLTSPGVPPFFAVTSGTTSGRTKYIPVTEAMISANKRAALDVVTWHFANRPKSRPLRGKTFMLGGSTSLVEEAPGIRSGDLSGIAVATQSLWTRPYAFPPTDLALMENWEEKIEVLARRALGERISIITGTPSWLLILFDRVGELAGGEPPFPDLELLVHGGVAWDLYRDRFRPHLQRTRAETREVYPASEGFLAIADRGDGEGMRLCLDNGVFFEFVPLDELDAERPTRHWVGTIEPDVDYAVMVTSCSGIYGYRLGDTVRFAETRPPRLLVTGRTSYMLSAFGEHLIGEEIEAGVEEAGEAVGLQIKEFTVGPVLSEAAGDRGHHLFIIEAVDGVPPAATVDSFREALDRRLGELNDDYAAHRVEGTGMAAPEIHFMPEGSFLDWMRAHGKLGGQHKVPRVMADTERFAKMRQEFGL